MIRSLDAGKINAGYINVDRLEAGQLTAKLANLGSAYISGSHTRCPDRYAIDCRECRDNSGCVDRYEFRLGRRQ